MSDEFDVVIVGGGIAGSALATVLARTGRRVKVLERDKVYLDRVRGEWMASWGVAEAQQLELMDILLDAGGHFVPRLVPYDENFPIEMAEKFAFDVSSLAPGLPDPFCMGHPAMCAALSDAALAAGAAMSRGVKSVKVQPGTNPEVSYDLNGEHVTLRPKLIVGADGRNSIVRKQINVEMQQDPPHNLLGGMLVEGESGWPQDSFTLGTEGNIHFLIFPQGGNRLRLYICYDFADRQRFTGPDKEKHFLEAFRLKCLPQGEAISRCRAISPFHSFSNEDHWTDDPTAPGVVLIGDAASHCDPVTGQGLSTGMRDVRILRDILADGNWSQAAFAPFVEERRERIRRLRVTARFTATLRAEFGEKARQRRSRASRRSNEEGYPSPSYSGFLGPEALPAENFEQTAIDNLLAP
jgi:2-polyprenyl-6-methoxyphenol hydroxylase-like FAD-dependent oxidoreductase